MLRLASRAVRPRCAAFATAAAAPSAPASPAAAAAAAAALQQGLALYRRILRAHRLKLPFHLRELGDRYVRDEFRKHRGADAKWLRGFVAGWEEYAQMLERQSAADVAGGFGGGGGGGGGGTADAATAGGIGRALSPEEIRGMSEEQRNQLAALRYEAEKAFRPDLDKDDDASGARK